MPPNRWPTRPKFPRPSWRLPAHCECLGEWCPSWHLSYQRGPYGFEHQLVLNARHHRDLPNSYCEHKVDVTLDRLLVVYQASQEIPGGDAIQRGDWAVPVQGLQNLDAVFGGEVAGQFAQVNGGAHAPRHGLTMQKAGVSGFGLERMAKGVTEIQDAAQVAFPFVARDHLGFHAQIGRASCRERV